MVNIPPYTTYQHGDWGTVQMTLFDPHYSHVCPCEHHPLWPVEEAFVTQLGHAGELSKGGNWSKFNGNSRILTWRYSTICLAIFWG